MPFGISLGGKKSKESSSTVFDQSTTPTVPDWLMGPAQGIAGTLPGLQAMDPNDLVAKTDPLQTLASTMAAMTNRDRNWYTDAMNFEDAKTPQMSSASLLEGLDNYMSPYTKDVVDTTLADFDVNAGKTRAQQTLDMAGQGAFGGSGAALTRSMTEGELSRARAASEAGLRDSAFTTGAGLSGQDAQRRQDASATNAQLQANADAQRMSNAQFKAQLGLNTESSTRDNIQMMSDMGQLTQRDTQNQLQAPFTQAEWLSNIFNSLNPSSFFGEDSSGTSNTKGKSSGLSFGVSAGK